MCRGSCVYTLHIHMFLIESSSVNTYIGNKQAEQVVKELSETEFPFSCAHGRPSVYPLISLPFTNNDIEESGRLKLERFKRRK